jgi:hypothetical protein
VAGCAFFAHFIYRMSAEVDGHATEEAEVKREIDHMRLVNLWIQDSSSNAPPPESASRPVPTSDRGKRIWVINRMLVDRSVWEREVMKRHGIKPYGSPPEWLTPRYQANARAYPQVGTFAEGRAASMAEIRKTSAAWMEERTAALARESGIPAGEIRALFPADFASITPEEAGLADAILELHRHLVRIDPRVHHAGGNELRFERQEDIRRLDELVDKVNDAFASSERGRQARMARQTAAFSRVVY